MGTEVPCHNNILLVTDYGLPPKLDVQTRQGCESQLVTMPFPKAHELVYITPPKDLNSWKDCLRTCSPSVLVKRVGDNHPLL
jgi:hypothetical protein